MKKIQEIKNWEIYKFVIGWEMRDTIPVYHFFAFNNKYLYMPVHSKRLDDIKAQIVDRI